MPCPAYQGKAGAYEEPTVTRTVPCVCPGIDKFNASTPEIHENVIAWIYIDVLQHTPQTLDSLGIIPEDNNAANSPAATGCEK